MCPGLDLYHQHAEPAQSLITAGEEVDDLDHDLSDLSKELELDEVDHDLSDLSH